MNKHYNQMLQFDYISENLRHLSEENSNFWRWLRDHYRKLIQEICIFIYSEPSLLKQLAWLLFEKLLCVVSGCFVQNHITTPQNTAKIDSLKLQKQQYTLSVMHKAKKQNILLFTILLLLYESQQFKQIHATTFNIIKIHLS